MQASARCRQCNECAWHLCSQRGDASGNMPWQLASAAPRQPCTMCLRCQTPMHAGCRWRSKAQRTHRTRATCRRRRILCRRTSSVSAKPPRKHVKMLELTSMYSCMLSSQCWPTRTRLMHSTSPDASDTTLSERSLRVNMCKDAVTSFESGVHPLCRRCPIGFEVADAIALLRMSDLYIESFEVKDVKVPSPVSHSSILLVPLAWQWLSRQRLCVEETVCSASFMVVRCLQHTSGNTVQQLMCVCPLQTLRGEHMSRCIGRLAGKVRERWFWHTARQNGTVHELSYHQATCLATGIWRSHVHEQVFMIPALLPPCRTARRSLPSRMRRRRGWCWRTPRSTFWGRTR